MKYRPRGLHSIFVRSSLAAGIGMTAVALAVAAG